MRFYDLHVHSAFSEGISSLEDLAKTAKFLDYTGICFSTYFESREKLKKIKEECEKISKKYGIQIWVGVEARDVKELRFLLKRRNWFDLLLVRGGNLRLNRVAVEHKGVDILTHPSFKRKDPGINHIYAKLAAKNKVAIEINFREILICNKASRSQVLKNFLTIVMLAKKYKFPLIISSGAISHFELKHPLVLSSFLITLGLDIKEAKKCISTIPKEILKNALEKKKFIAPGIKVVE
jgi:ribonuclease P/MRP protein subunit RPP1